MACHSSPTKRLSKRYLLKQTQAGYRPPALRRILDTSGRSDGAARRDEQLRRKGHAALANAGRNVGNWIRRPIAERSPPMAVGSRGQAIGDRPTTRLGTAENPPHCEGRIVAGIAATGRDSTRWHARRDRRGLSRPVATGYRRPATPARTTRPRRSDRPRSGRHPRLFAAGLTTFHSQLSTRVPVRPRRRRGGALLGSPSFCERDGPAAVNVNRGIPVSDDPQPLDCDCSDRFVPTLRRGC